MEFNLSTYFNGFDADAEKTVDFDNVDQKLHEVTNSLANNPESLHYQDELFEDVMELTHGYRSLDSRHQKQLVYLLTSSFHAVGVLINGSIEAGDFVDSIDLYKHLLEKYGYLMFACLKFLGKEDSPSGSKAKAINKQPHINWKANCVQVEDCLTSIASIVKIDLEKIFVTTPERDLFIELFTRPIINLMESYERMKIVAIKLLMFKIIAISVKQHGHAAIIQHSIIQCLTYYVHLPQYMAELLHLLADQYDYMVFTEEVLRELSQTQFNSNDSNGPKAVSQFLIKLSELTPRLILKQLSCVSQLLDNSNPTLRCSVVESCGNIVVEILQNNESNTEENHNGNQQVEGLLDLLQERFLDSNPYVRTKAFQALTKVAGSKARLTKRRQTIMQLCVKSLDDRSTLVRRNAIKLMSKLLLNHQFTNIHEAQLGLTFWKSQLREAESELEKLLPTSPKKKAVGSDDDDSDIEMEDAEGNELDNENIDGDEDSDSHSETEKEQNGIAHNDFSCQNVDTNELIKAKLKVAYYDDAVHFIHAVHRGTEVVSNLLFSKNRNETLDSMDFLVLADAYGIENSKEGIRRMLHLVWIKGSSDEGKSVRSHLIDCYKNLFLTAPSNSSSIDRAAYIAKNLIGLTIGASVADLASLEKLLGLMYTENLINQEVISVLWQIYSYDVANEKTIQQRHGAIIVAGMLALENCQIVVKGLDSLLNIGLGEIGQKDLVLSKYTCVALQRITPSGTNTTTNANTPVPITREDDIVDKLKSILQFYSENPEWYSVAEQAIAAIFKACPAPDKICSQVIKEKSKSIFQDSNANELQIIGLSQLLFIVGHVAIKTIVYLEKLETQFKKKKHEAEGNKNKADNGEEQQNELELIGGTSEDDFADAIVHVKERELLYGESSILARFGPIVKEICANNKNYDDKILQRSAVLCLAKLMCVSSIYCEENLPLLITIMEKSDDPVIRCNCVLGLGDMAVCFNNIVDESTDFIYRRLTDDNIMVQRTCLMTVTFLILAGQVKVKGQLSAMAKCLENEDQGISDMCRLFFAELATKDNAIYNGFIDIFSGLSSDETLDKDALKRIVKFLISFIDKEKHQKQLAEKLVARLIKCSTEQQWNDVAFVLNSIPYKNDNINTVLDEGFKLVLSRQ
jgi:condensin complex subunit 1